MSAVVSEQIETKKYGRLLARSVPKVIKTEEENERMLAEVWKLMKKGEENLSPEELALLELMTTLIEDFEREHYPIDDAPPHEVLKSLMEEHGLRQKDLMHIFGSSGIASEVVNGKRSISKAQAKALGEHFHVPADVFI